MTRLTGGEAVVRMLAEHGVEIAFGMGGFQPLPYYDALARQDRIRHVLIRDEKHGAFAADAWARVRNRPAVADATLGPGATNLISGAAESFGAAIPLLLLTGEVNSLIAGRAATQESDQVGMLRPSVKSSIKIDRIERIPELIRRAVTISTAGRPGPVHVDVPEEIMHGTHDYADRDLYADADSSVVGGRRARPDWTMVDRAAHRIRAAERPLILAGGGIHLSEAYAELRALAEAWSIPVAYTISGKGSIPDSHPLCVGLVGRYSRFANDLLASCDLLIVAGSKLGEIATARWTAIPDGLPVVHLDVDPTEIGKVYPTALGLVGDARLGLADLGDAIGAERPSARIVEARLTAIDTARQAWAATAAPRYASDERPLHMARVLAELRRAAPPGTIVVADGGFAAHWSALLYDVEETGRTYIANRGHAAIGYGLPGAIGASLAAPGRPVVALCGDNGFAMAVAELETARRVGARIVALVVDNATLGYVKALQHGLYDDRFISVDFLDVDYGAVARAFGCHGERISEPDALGPALTRAFEREDPSVLDVMITTDPARMLPGIDARAVRSR
jgi:acetolactate synthase-1/2/3 large subunit